MLQMILPALVSGGLSAIGGKAANDAAAKQSRLAIIQKNIDDANNIRRIEAADAIKTKLGQKLLKVPHKVDQWSDVTTSSESLNDVDMDGMLAAAEKAGINPITFLRNGGLAAYSRNRSSSNVKTHESMKETGHNAVAAYQLMTPTIFQSGPTPVENKTSSTGAIVGGIADGFRTFMDQYNRQNTQDFQRDLMMTQLDAMQSRQDQAVGSRFGLTPGFSTSGSTISPVTKGGLSKLGDVTKPTAGEVTVTNPFMSWKVDPTQRDGESYEARYTDAGGTVAAPFVYYNDLLYNLTGKTQKDRKSLNPAALPVTNMLNLYKTLGGVQKSIYDYLGGLKLPALKSPVNADAMGNSW